MTTMTRRGRSPSSSSPILFLAATLALLFLLAAVETEGSPRASDHTRDTNMPWHADPRPRLETDPRPLPDSDAPRVRAHDRNLPGQQRGARQSSNPIPTLNNRGANREPGRAGSSRSSSDPSHRSSDP